MNVVIVGVGLIGGSLARAYRLAWHHVFVRDSDKRVEPYAVLSGIAEAIANKTLLMKTLHQSTRQKEVIDGCGM